MKQYLYLLPMPINQPIPLSQERKKGAATGTVLTLTAVHTYRTYMYNQQAVSSRLMKKIKTRGKKKKNKRKRNGKEMEREKEREKEKEKKRKEKAISGAGG